MIVIFKQDKMSLKYIVYNDHVIGDISFNQFVDMYM